MDLRNKTALITGTSRGIGRAVALRLAEAGMSMVITARSRRELESLAEEVRQRGGRAEPVPCDLLVPESVRLLGDTTRRIFGALDLLVNNAGESRPGRVHESPQKELDAVLDLNLRAVMSLTRELLPGMIEKGGGTIINVSSIAGFYGAPGLASYAAAKAGLHAWSDSLWQEARQDGIRVCLLCLGRVDSRREWERHAMALEDVAETIHFVAASSSRVCPIHIRLREQLEPE